MSKWYEFMVKYLEEPFCQAELARAEMLGQNRTPREERGGKVSSRKHLQIITPASQRLVGASSSVKRRLTGPYA